MTANSNARRFLSFLRFLPTALALLALLASTPGWAQTRPFAQDALADLEAAVGGPVKATVSARSGLVTFLSFAPHQQTLGKLPSEAPAEDRAREFLGGYGAAFGVFAPESLAVQRVDERDAVGMEHVRFRQMHQGVPVTGGELTVHLRGSNVVAVNAKTVADLAGVATRPVVTAAEATVLAAEVLARELGVTDAELSAPRLELLNKGHLGGRGLATSLVWFVEARKIDLREFVWIDATGGKLVLRFSQLTDALSRTIHDTAGTSTLPGPVARTEGQGATGDADVDAAYDFSGDTYNYFFNEHGRDSYDGAGAALISTVDYCPSGCPYNNAFWNGVQMVYGPGFPLADDVDAHELAHAVTEHTANLFYYMQSGALNESFSDIFGETVDLTNGAGTDSPNNTRTPGGCSMFNPSPPGPGADNSYRWLMGEDAPINAIRDMWNPTCFGDPGKMSDSQFVCTGGTGDLDDAGGVHQNSGVPNHAYALMVDGGTYNGKTVSPALGFTKAGKIQYRALANYLTSASDFLDNYNALLQSCDDLIGIAGITPTDCGEVKDALDAVEMASVWNCSPVQAAIPDLCPGGQAPSLWSHEDFEGLPFVPCPSDTFPLDWCTNTSASLLGPFATSGTQSMWGYSPDSVDSRSFTRVFGGTLPAGAHMQFNHSFGFESSASSYWDGGVIEYSTTGGAPWMDAGGMISAGQAYGGPLSSCCSNPLGGRSAFVSDTWGFTATQLDLSSLGGGSFAYRLTIGTDTIIDDYGWFVDDVSIYTCAACLATRTLDSTYNGLSSFYGASVSITAGSGFKVDFDEAVTLEAPAVEILDDFSVIGDLEIGNATCP